jgi:ubiquitin-conjugating enzyme E2 J1
MAPSPTIRRLLRETAELSASSSNPSPAFHAAPVSDSDLHEWHFTLLGPPSPSPYAGGLYHGRITLPPTYPLKPPNFRFLTPSGRFEVNREICLSISGFHEETWMPAWGVRTALTALRTFMAEPGTAGQVGGMEAPADVRKRLARESRDWRCGMGCGGRSNLDLMRDWWGLCREKGVKVNEEGSGEGTEMEVLPEGVKLEARGKDEKGATQQQPGELAQAYSQHQTRPKISGPAEASPPHPLPPSQPPSDTSSQQIPTSISAQRRTSASTASSTSNLQPPLTSFHRTTSPIPHAATPTPESAQSHAESYLSSSELEATQTHQRRPMMSIHSPPLVAANAALNNPVPLQTQQQHDQQQQQELRARQVEGAHMLTIDRAIAGVFLMLILMLLKKIFYPAGQASGGMGYVDGDGRGRGFYMEREM